MTAIKWQLLHLWWENRIEGGIDARVMPASGVNLGLVDAWHRCVPSPAASLRQHALSASLPVTVLEYGDDSASGGCLLRNSTQHRLEGCGKSGVPALALGVGRKASGDDIARHCHTSQREEISRSFPHRRSAIFGVSLLPSRRLSPS
jgi:hypothetical protein